MKCLFRSIWPFDCDWCLSPDHCSISKSAKTKSCANDLRFSLPYPSTLIDLKVETDHGNCGSWLLFIIIHLLNDYITKWSVSFRRTHFILLIAFRSVPPTAFRAIDRVSFRSADRVSLYWSRFVPPSPTTFCSLTVLSRFVSWSLSLRWQY